MDLSGTLELIILAISDVSYHVSLQSFNIPVIQLCLHVLTTGLYLAEEEDEIKMETKKQAKPCCRERMAQLASSISQEIW